MSLLVKTVIHGVRVKGRHLGGTHCRDVDMLVLFGESSTWLC
jgi:hypothetical protein